jgi:hypothetical protein
MRRYAARIASKVTPTMVMAFVRVDEVLISEPRSILRGFRFYVLAYPSASACSALTNGR